jgi:hypothetical protein
MSDFDWRDPQVDRVLNAVGTTVAGYFDAPGADAVYATVRQRRRNRAVAVGVLAVAMLGGPAVGFALAAGDGSGPPAGGGRSATASAPPSPSASASPSSSPSASATPAAPDGRISLRDLKRAKLDLPPWPATVPECEQSAVEFVGQPVYTDVDHDGAEETVAWLHCQPHAEYKVAKVMVFDRDAAGKVVTLGQVLQTPSGGDEGVGMWKVWAIQATADGHVRVDVGDYFPCCGTARDLPQHQWRTYGWDGRRFVQTGGPTKFGPNPNVTDLRVRADALVMNQQADGSWQGTLTITITNAGPSRVPASLIVQPPGGLDRAGTGAGWARCQRASMTFGPATSPGWECDGGTIKVGASVTLRLAFVSQVRPSGSFDIWVLHEGSQSEAYPDKHQDDNHASAAARAG